MKFKISLSVVAVFLVSSLFAAIPPAENLLPADTLALVTVPDFSTLRAASAQSPEWLLWNDPAMKPFHDDFVAKWNNKFIASMEQNLGLHLSDFLPLLQGQLTFAVTQNGWNGSGPASPAMVLLLDARGKSDLLATNLALLKGKWIASGRPVQSEILEGIKFSVVTFSTNAPMPLSSVLSQGANSSSAAGMLYIGQYQSLLIAGSSVKVVASVAAHLTGGANPALKDNAEFAADRLSQFHDQPLYYGWFNAKIFFNVLAEAPFPQDSGSFRMPWDQILLASGFNGLKSVSFTYREDHDGAQIELYARAAESTRQGLLKIVAAAPKDAKPPLFVPADAVKFWRWRVDGQQSWAELRKTLVAISPSALTTLDTIIQTANLNAQQQDPNFDIRKNLIGNLGDDWMSFEKAPSGKTLEDLNSAPWLFLFAANNADQAALAIKTVAGMSSPGDAPQTRDFLGRKIYTISLPGGRGANAASRSLYCAASGGYVAVTMDVSMIENYLRSDNGKPNPLREKPGLLDAAQRVGGMDNGLFGYQNQRELARELFVALKNDPSLSSSALNPLPLPFGSTGSSIRDLMDFSLLPDFGQVEKYFNFTVYGGSATSDGLDIKFFTPRPPELN
jgi:hypothetical protein